MVAAVGEASGVEEVAQAALPPASMANPRTPAFTEVARQRGQTDVGETVLMMDVLSVDERRAQTARAGAGVQRGCRTGERRDQLSCPQS